MKNLYFAYKRNNHLTHILTVLLVILIFVVGMTNCASVVKNTTNAVENTTIELGDEYIQYGVVFFMNQQYDIALELFEKALREFLSTYGKRHPKVASAYFNIGTTHLAKGDTLKAKSYYKTVMEICENDNSKPCPEIREGIRNNLNLLNRYEQPQKTDISL